MTTEDFINAMKTAQNILDEHTQVMMLSSKMAKKLIAAETNCSPNVLFMLDNHVSDNEVMILQGELKANMLEWYRENTVKLYTFDELKRMEL